MVLLIAVPITGPDTKARPSSSLLSVAGSARGRVACGAYMAQEGIGHPGRVLGTGLQLTQEKMAVEVPQLLQVAKELGTLATEALGHIRAIQLREVVLHGVVQGTDILPLRSHHLRQHQLKSTREVDSSVCVISLYVSVSIKEVKESQPRVSNPQNAILYLADS